MGLSDRQYPPSHSGNFPGSMRRVGGSSPFSLAGLPVVKWLLILNIGVFIAELIISGISGTHMDVLFTKRYGMFSVDTGLLQGQVWRLITCQFLHGDGHHLLFNMMGLFVFGRFVEKWWGSRRFLFFYLICGIAGPLFYTALIYLPGFFSQAETASYMLGASAGVYGVLVGTTIAAPNMRVLLFFVIPVQLRVMALLILGYAVLAVIFEFENAGGEAAHLGGALLAFILMKKPQLVTWISKTSGGKNRGSQRKKIIAEQRERARRSKMRPRVGIDMEDSKVDAILDKISSQGLHSLTDKERKILEKARKPSE